jgi:hypothetical protein
MIVLDRTRLIGRLLLSIGAPAPIGLWAMGYGLWAMGYGLWAMGYGLWAMGYGLWGYDLKQ